MTVMLTKHGQERSWQRGLSVEDVEIIRAFGTAVADSRGEVYYMRSRDVAQLVGQLKRRIQRVERLVGCAAVLAGDSVVTVYRASEAAEKRLLRRRA